MPVIEGGIEILHLLSFATRAEAFYLALSRGHREVSTVYKTLCAGLMDVVIFGTPEKPLPADVQLFLSEEHNNWHGGAKSNAIQQLSWVHQAEQEWLKYAEEKKYSRRGLPTSGDFTYDKLAWEYVRQQRSHSHNTQKFSEVKQKQTHDKTEGINYEHFCVVFAECNQCAKPNIHLTCITHHRLWKERFGTTMVMDFYEKGRLIHNSLVACGLLETVTEYACSKVDFVNPEFKTMSFFRILRHLQLLFERLIPKYNRHVVDLFLLEVCVLVTHNVLYDAMLAKFSCTFSDPAIGIGFTAFKVSAFRNLTACKGLYSVAPLLQIRF